MQNLHVLYQLLIPALFLVLWALNQLFNKEGAARRIGPEAASDLGPAGLRLRLDPDPDPGRSRSEYRNRSERGPRGRMKS